MPQDFTVPPLLRGYPLPIGGWDEALEPDGGLRPHWREFAQSLEAMGGQGLSACSEHARRSMAENGVTYNVYGDPRGMDRPWRFDPVPLLIPQEEWKQLEAGLIQRARLLTAVLADLYGPRRLLEAGALPPGVVLGNPGFQHACRDLRPPGGAWLHLYAADIARGPDGRWRVFADRTGAPSGAGYALENRVVLSRSMPEDFRRLNVKRMAAFFRDLREHLPRVAAAPERSDSPRHVVILTPGPRNETYFEHAYLSRHLGFPLVEGGDLTVRNRRVFLKTLEGLRPVDVILRRVDDAWCDPLELRQDSLLGVPGLLEAARAGNVVVANPIGSVLAESPALLAFLPDLCPRLLGEELLLPNTATWWCGQKAAREHVLQNLGQLLVKSAFAEKAFNPIFGSNLDDEQRENLMARIETFPERFVGQERIPLSSAPVWTGERMEPRPVALRVYVAATAGGGFTVMPGGLTRVSAFPNVPVVSMQSGGGSKDTWILSDEPVAHVPLLPPSLARPPKAKREGADLPSRVADNLFWLGRYAERTEVLMRVMRVVLNRLTDESAAGGAEAAGMVMRLLPPLGIIAPEAIDDPPLLEKFEREVLRVLFHKDHPGGMHDSLGRLRMAAWKVRDRLSLDTWRILHDLQMDAPPERRTPDFDDCLLLLNRLIRGLAAFSGMVMENMTRGPGWRFLDLGRRLERASSLLLLARAALNEDPEGRYLPDPLLDIADSAMTYRRRHFAQARTDAVLGLLLSDETNPRSALFQLLSIRNHLEHLPPPPLSVGTKHRAAGVLCQKLRALDTDDPPAALAKECAGMVSQLRQLSDRVTAAWFSHALGGPG